MNHRKHGLRLSGLLAVMALGVMAFAASAQALNPGFLVNKKSAALLLANVTAVKDGPNKMLVPALNFELTCNDFTVDTGHIANQHVATAVLLYTECTTLDLTTKAEIPCEVVQPVKASATILPAELTDGEPAVLAEEIKALIRLTKEGDLTKPCTLPEDNVVTGDVCFRIVPPTNDTAKVLIETPATCKNRATLGGLLNEVASGGFPDSVKYGANPVTLDGKAILSLLAPHLGVTFGVSLF